MKKEHAVALFEMAGFEVKNIFKSPNLYHEPWSEKSPWWLIDIKDIGIIKIGWRKRVICIDWEATDYKGLIHNEHNVTVYETGTHAWSYAKALQYLEMLKVAILKHEESLGHLIDEEMVVYHR